MRRSMRRIESFKTGSERGLPPVSGRHFFTPDACQLNIHSQRSTHVQKSQENKLQHPDFPAMNIKRTPEEAVPAVSWDEIERRNQESRRRPDEQKEIKDWLLVGDDAAALVLMKKYLPAHRPSPDE